MARFDTATDAGNDVNVKGSKAEVFDQLTQVDPPRSTEVLFDTACVLGGSIAGLLAARVLADHARKVLVVERDVVNVDGLPREGVPHDRQGHALLPGGLAQIERWFPGYTREAQDLGAVMADPVHSTMFLDGRQQARAGDVHVLGASRPFFESRMRARVLALPNVVTVRARANGLRYRDDAVCGVLCSTDAGEEVIAADFVVDAMGRASRLSDWLEQDGYHRPALQRLPTGIGYATAYFARPQTPDELELTNAIARYTGSGPDEIAAAGVNAIENDQWQMMIMTYGRNEAGGSVDAFRATCAKLPPVFGEASSDEITRDVLSYHQADSRRRDFVGLDRFPARLVSTGDAVASFNPVYGQGISSAALHASCLSRYLTTGPDLQGPATSFFELQQVVVDAAWTLSAGADAARRDALDGVEVPTEVAHQRWVMAQLIEATLVDETVGAAFDKVASMLVHPDVLADPDLRDRALAAKKRLAADDGVPLGLV